MNRPSHRLRPPRPPVQAATSLLALAVLIGLVVGIPLLLALIVGWPLPHTLPSLDELRRGLSGPVPWSTVARILACIGWLLWAQFSLCVLVELRAGLSARRLPARRLPLSGLSQQAARRLVAALLLITTTGTLTPTVLSTAGAAIAARPAIAQAAAATHADHPVPQQTTRAGPPTQREGGESRPREPAKPEVAQSAPAGRATTKCRVWTVERNDTLWAISHRCLGAGERWPALWELNRGRSQPGGRTLQDPNLIYPGWSIAIPTHWSVDPDGVTDTGQTIVRRGDTLSGIAQAEYGEAGLWPRIYDANTDQIHDPDLIIPGQILDIPPVITSEGDRPDRPEAPPTPGPPADPGSESPPIQPSTQAPVPTLQPTAPSPAQPVTPTAVPPPPTATPAPSAASEPPAIEEQDDGEHGRSVLIALAGYGAFTASGILAALGVKRLIQQRRRRLGERIRLPAPEVTPFEALTRAASVEPGPGLLDRALRTLASAAATSGADLPELAYIRVGEHGIDLHLTAPAAATLPFISQPEGRSEVWHCPADAAVLDADRAAAVPAPYPALVTVGHDDAGSAILIDLEKARTLTVTGTPQDRLAVLRALVVELCAAQLADDLLVVAVSVASELATARYADSLRLLELDDLDEAIDTIAAWENTTSAALTQDGTTSLRQARLQQVGSDLWTPRILVTGVEPTGEQARRLSRILTGSPRGCTAAVTTAPIDEQGWTLPADNAANVLEPLGVQLSAQRIDQRAYGQFIHHLEVANDTTSVPTGGSWWPGEDEPFDPLHDLPANPLQPARQPTAADQSQTRAKPAAPVPAQADEFESDRHAREALASEVTPPVTDRAISASAAPVIRVLGPVELQGANGEVESSKTARLLELAAYLALHPGHDHVAVTKALWTAGSTGNRNTAMSKLRRWLGNTSDGQPYLPRVEDDHYRLHPDVGCDWTTFRRHARRGLTNSDPEELEQALELVRGQPFEGTRSGRYGWAENLRQEMISSIVDVAAQLAKVHLDGHNWAGAATAAERGLRGAPGDENLWRIRFRAIHATGDRGGLHSALTELDHWNETHDLDRDPETDELLHQLLDPQARRAV